MYREKDFQDCLSGLVGWRQNTNPDYASLPDSLVASSSGLYFQDEHPLITIENIDQADRDYDKFNFPAYAVGTTYANLARIRFTDGKVYESLQAGNVGHDPTDVGSVWWILVDLSAQKIDQITRSAATKLLSRVFIDKKLNEITKSIFENIQLFDGAGSLLNKEVKQSRFVGFEIFLKDNKDILTVIRKLGTQFSQANPDFDLYIYHSSQSLPIYVIDVPLIKAVSFEWTKILDDANNPIQLKYLSDDYGVGGSFYIGYYEDDLVGQAINKGYDFASTPYCVSCNNDFRYWSSWSKFVRIQPFTIQSSDLHVDRTLWDINRNQYAFSKNFGLNLDLTVKCDVTDFLCRERDIFADVLMKQVCVDVLNLIAYSVRNNVNAKITQDKAMYELNNKDNYTPGAVKRLENALKAVSFDISDMNDACLPCDQKYGSNWTNI